MKNKIFLTVLIFLYSLVFSSVSAEELPREVCFNDGETCFYPEDFYEEETGETETDQETDKKCSMSKSEIEEKERRRKKFKRVTDILTRFGVQVPYDEITQISDEVDDIYEDDCGDHSEETEDERHERKMKKWDRIIKLFKQFGGETSSAPTAEQEAG